LANFLRAKAATAFSAS